MARECESATVGCDGVEGPADHRTLARRTGPSPPPPSNRTLAPPRSYPTLAPRTVDPSHRSHRSHSEFHVVEQTEIPPHFWNQILDQRQMISIKLVGDVFEAGRERMCHGPLAERI